MVSVMWRLIDKLMVADCNASDITMFPSYFLGTSSCAYVCNFYCFGITFNNILPNSEVSYAVYLVNVILETYRFFNIAKR
jgi:hypothetical protein